MAVTDQAAVDRARAQANNQRMIQDYRNQRAAAARPMPEGGTAYAQRQKEPIGPNSYGFTGPIRSSATTMGAVQPYANPSARAMQQANPNASFQRPVGLDPRADRGFAGSAAGGVTSPDRGSLTDPQLVSAAQQLRGSGGVTAADMVDVPGMGQMPRALLQKLQQRMQQQQQQQQQLPTAPLPAGTNGPWMRGSGEPQPGYGPLLPNQVRSDGSSDNMARYGPPVRAMPADNRYVGTPYGNDNIGVGVTPPVRGGPYVPPAQSPMVAQLPPPAAAPPPPPPSPPTVPLSPLAISPNGQQMMANGAANLAQQQVTSPGPDWFWHSGAGDWADIETGQIGTAAKAPVAAPGPPPPAPTSPIAGHLWGGGPEAFGAGRNPMAASMGDFYTVYGGGRPGAQLPTQQQLYEQFNAIQSGNPYMQAGAVNNGNTVFNSPSWYGR